MHLAVHINDAWIGDEQLTCFNCTLSAPETTMMLNSLNIFIFV